MECAIAESLVRKVLPQVGQEVEGARTRQRKIEERQRAIRMDVRVRRAFRRDSLPRSA